MEQFFQMSVWVQMNVLFLRKYIRPIACQGPVMGEGNVLVEVAAQERGRRACAPATHRR